MLSKKKKEKLQNEGRKRYQNLSDKENNLDKKRIERT